MRPTLIEQIHTQAIEISSRYKRAEAELVDAIQQVEEYRVFLRHGHSSLFSYTSEELGLSENVAFALITVARKSREVPELKTHLKAGSITLSNARRVSSVITPENQTEWIQKACELSNRELDKAITKVRPKEAVVESTTYVSENRLRLVMGISEEGLERFKRVQDLLCQSRKTSVTLEDSLEAMTSEFLKKHDPVKKAERNQGKTIPTETVETLVTLRVPVPAEVEHRVNLRDRGKCTYKMKDGKKCGQTRWIHLHHVIPVSEGGKNTAENLITLCSTHHALVHLPEQVA